PASRSRPASGWRAFRRASNILVSRKRDPHAAVLLALFLDLGHADRADLAGAAHMRAAAGLQVETNDLDQPHAARAHRRFDRHGLDEARIGLQFGVRNPA